MNVTKLKNATWLAIAIDLDSEANCIHFGVYRAGGLFVDFFPLFTIPCSISNTS